MPFSNTKVTLHYFVIPTAKPTMALGENVNLMLKDSGLTYEYLRHTREEWLELKKKMAEQNIYASTMPAVEIDGKFYAKTLPTMRYLSCKLGKYGGSDDEQRHYLDTLADTCSDWFHSYRQFFRGGEEEALKKHVEEDTKKFLGIFENVYGVNDGPFILGSEISYVDFLVYHNMDDDRALDLAKTYTNLARFIEAIQQRPNLSEYFTSLADAE
ncbi:class gamma glutathione S-transferase 2 [Hesseltinella vesiculosa]|uniref:Class gamma glutathione S-transferase 2 n=1 Tax=Hesseltinella vesiculosa TaxID=101127 RepID=A0A1X2GP57_9FUNG|nr:class gamma glutathione S-transferase 2 [Hesseltinella vesiculosa]